MRFLIVVVFNTRTKQSKKNCLAYKLKTRDRERESEQKGMKNRLCDDNGWNGVGAIKKLHSNIIINSNGYVHSFAQQ